jgi:hypothetical protein
MSLALEISTCDEWHILKGETQYGPYTYEEMIRMMQSSLVFGFDYVWGPHMENWSPLADREEFSADRLARLAEKNQAQEVFQRREHERIYCKLPVYVNDQHTLWEGMVENLSEGGALILMKNPVLLPGHIVHVHFRARNDKDIAFNCTAQILTKRLVKSRIQHDTGIHYAVKFLDKPDVGNQQIDQWIQEFKKEQTK